MGENDKTVADNAAVFIFVQVETGDTMLLRDDSPRNMCHAVYWLPGIFSMKSESESRTQNLCQLHHRATCGIVRTS